MSEYHDMALCDLRPLNSPAAIRDDAPPPGKEEEIGDRIFFARIYPGGWDKQMARMARGGLQAIPFGMEDVS